MRMLPFAFCLLTCSARLTTAAQQKVQTEKVQSLHYSTTLKSISDEQESESLAMEEKHRQTVWYAAFQKENPDYFEVAKLFEDYFEKNKAERSKPKQLCADWLKTQVFYLDGNNKVIAPPATDFNSINKAQSRTWAAVTDTVAGSWRMLGPRNIYETRYSGKGNKGGYVSIARIDPTNPDKLFVGFITGGLWVSKDGGNVWQLTDANMPDAEYVDIDVCHSDNNIVYALSKSGAVTKSEDGGLTWAATAINKTAYPDAVAYDIAASPKNKNIVLVRWGSSLYRTTDGGKSWKPVLKDLQNYSLWGGTGISSEMLDFHAAHNKVVYLVDRSDKQAFVTLYRSGNAGASFKNLGNIYIPKDATGSVVGWAKILSTTNNPSVVYLAVGTGKSAYGHNPIQLFKLNAKTGEVLQTRVNLTGEQGVHHGDIAMDLHNDNNIIYGTYGETTAHYSTDNGATFKKSGTTVHADLRTLSMVGGKVLLGNDGEATLSADGGATFTNLTAAVSNHELWGFGAAFKSGVLGAGLNHGPLMIREHEGPQGWYNAMGADQGNSDVNPLDDKYLYSQGYSSYHVVRTGQYQMNHRTPQQIDPGGIYAYFNSMEFHPNLYYSIISHHAGQYPKNNSNLSLWKRSLVRSDDNGLTINKVIKTFDQQVFREKICMTNPNYMYVVEGLSKNKLWKTTDGGTTWTDITPTATVTGTAVRNISDIAVSDANGDEIWVTYSGVQNSCQVLHSKDGGGSFTNLTMPVLTSFPITKIIFQRGTNGGVFVGNKSGVFYRNNTMSNWQPIGQGLPMTDIRFMFINYYNGKLQIGTSRGAWEHDLHETSKPMAQISADKDSVKCSAPKVQFRDYSVVKRGPQVSYTWRFAGGVPATSKEENPLVSYEAAAPGSYDVQLTVTDATGSSTQTLSNFIKVLTKEDCMEKEVTQKEK